MIILYNPRLAKPKNRRFPLSILALAAVLEGQEDYEIVDGNLDTDPDKTIAGLCRGHHVELLAVSVMPGPQMVSAMRSCKHLRAMFPHIPVVLGRILPFCLWRVCAQCRLCGLYGTRPGRKHLA
jgi:hypothetical protein